MKTSLTGMTLGSKSGNKTSRKSTNPLRGQRAQLSSRIANAHISSGKGTMSGSSSSRHVNHSLSRVTNGAHLPGQKESLTATRIGGNLNKIFHPCLDHFCRAASSFFLMRQHGYKIVNSPSKLFTCEALSNVLA